MWFLRLLGRLDARLKRWQFVTLMLVVLYAITAGVMWWLYPSNPPERQVGSRFFYAFLLLPTALVLALAVWGIASLITRTADRRGDK